MKVEISKDTSFNSKLKEHSNRGSVYSFGVLFVLILSSLTIAHLYHATYELQNIKFRSNSYLCFKSLIKETKHYISKVNGLNPTIRNVYYASLPPIPYVQKALKATHKLLKLIQYKHRISYMKKVEDIKYCSRPRKLTYLISNIYRGRIIFQRKYDGTTMMRKRKWKATLPAITKKHILADQFGLEATFQSKGNNSKKLKVSTREIGLKELSRLKQLFGLLF